MISATTFFSLSAAFIAHTLSSPLWHDPTVAPMAVMTQADDIITGSIVFPTASGGALDADPTFTVFFPTDPTPSPGPTTTPTNPDPDIFILEIVNKANASVSTSHARNPGVPPPLGNPLGGVMPNGSVDTLTIPNGWAGQIAVNKEGIPIDGDESIIEGSFRGQARFGSPDPNAPVVAIDVSFVAGFSFPIVCTCPLDGDKYLSGCDKNLWHMHYCEAEDYDGDGNCRNPYRGKSKSRAAPFFEPCQGLAYTFETDWDAESNGECQSGMVRCTIFPGL